MGSTLFLLNSSIFVILLSSIVAFIAIKNKKYGIFHIVCIYFGLSIIDTFLPSIIYVIYGFETLPPWINPYTNAEMSIGLLYYTLFYIIMFSIMIALAKGNQSEWLKSFQRDNLYIRKRIDFFLVMICSILFIGLFYEISSYGGISEWIFNKFTFRFDPNPRDRNLLEIFLITFPWRALFNSLVFLAFLYRFRFNRPKAYGIFFPLLGIFFALSTSFRGSILIFLLGLFFMENIRIYIHRKSEYKSSFGKGRETINKPRYYVFAFLTLSAFIAYGSIRGNYVDEVLGREQDNQSAVYLVLSQGSGIQGITSIMKRYGNDLDYLMGKTYIDMLLLPIPRVIYTSKPEWYGIDDITTGMGWAESSQSAVTMPGEAYANFGWFGLSIAILYGLFFGLFLRLINNKGGIHVVLYASVIIPIIFVSNWMSFTGIMNMFFTTVFLFVLLFLIKTRFKIG